MRALQIDAPGTVRVVEVPLPALSPGHALLRIRTVGMCGSDLNTFRGRNPMVTFPRIPGHEIAATLERIEGDAPGFVPGMNVTVSPYTSCGRCASCLRKRPNACKDNQTLGVQRDGALTDLLVVPIDRLYAAEGLSLHELSLVEPLTVGFHAAARGRVESSEIVLVIGCGAVGLGAISASTFRGAQTIAADIDDAKLAIAAKAGAALTINTAKEDLAQRLAEITGGAGPDVVIEAVGSPETYRAAVEAVAFTGRVVFIGYAKAEVPFETRLFVQKELDILGSRNALPDDFRAVIRMLQQHTFPVKEMINLIVPLDQAGAALQRWADDPGSIGKILVEVG